MKSSLLRSLFLALPIVMSCPLMAYSHGESARAWEVPEFELEKIYVAPEQIVMTSDAIFFLSSEGVLVQTFLVAVDAGGLYVLSAYQCPACGRWNRNNKCGNERCSMYGK